MLIAKCTPHAFQFNKKCDKNSNANKCNSIHELKQFHNTTKKNLDHEKKKLYDINFFIYKKKALLTQKICCTFFLQVNKKKITYRLNPNRLVIYRK